MAKTTPETLLLSSIINLGDAHAARNYGIQPQHFYGHREEYEWILGYAQRYGSCPSATEVLTAFPALVYSPDHCEPRWPAHEVKMSYASQDLMRRMTKASLAISRGEVEGAYASFEGMVLETVSERPTNLLIDHAYLDDYEHTAEMRVPMPWATLQGLTNGMGPGELWYFGARQGQGKSSYLIDLATEAAKNGARVCIYSLEMTKRQVQVRSHASMAHRLGRKVDSQAMLHRRWDKLAYKELLQEIEDNVAGELHIHDTSMGRVTPGVVAARAGDYDLSVIDYVGLMYTDDGRPAISDYRAIAEISNNLKEIALSKMTRLIGASQINREGDTRGKNPPELKTLAQSDHLGNDGDVVCTMKRYGDGAAVFSVEKNRHGPSKNKFFTLYKPNRGNFSEITRDVADQIWDDSDD